MTAVPHGTPRKSFDSAGVQFAWDATSISLASECLRKYQYRMIDGWRSSNKSVHLLFGGFYATALEHFYKKRALGATLADALADVVHETLIASWDHTTNQPLDFNHDSKTRWNLIRTIVWYIAEFGDESANGLTTYHLKDGTPAVELSFNFEADDGILFTGHLDRVAEMNGDRYILDQKTTGTTISSYFFDQFSPNNQVSLYTFAGKLILDTPISGMIIDAAQIAIGFSRFARGFVHRAPETLTEWRENALYTIKLARQATALNFFPMNLSSCGNYGGCEFRKVCSIARSQRATQLKSDFKQTEYWDPLESR